MSFYKAIKRSCVFNDFKSDRKALFCVVLLDLCELPAVACRCPRRMAVVAALGIQSRPL